MIRLCLFFLSFYLPLFAVKINIVNDSEYFLHGILFDHNHKQIGSFEIASGSTYIWYDNQFNATDYVKGPFSITFTCPSGDTYGRIFRINNNSTVRSKSAYGPKKCKNHDEPSHRDWSDHPPHNKYRYYQHNS